jgi:YVTN family beta-propeller protein
MTHPGVGPITALATETFLGEPKRFVTNDGSSSVSVIDTVSNTVTATVAVGSEPEGVAITPDGIHVYVTNEAMAADTKIRISRAADSGIAAAFANSTVVWSAPASPDFSAFTTCLPDDGCGDERLLGF